MKNGKTILATLGFCLVCSHLVQANNDIKITYEGPALKKDEGKWTRKAKPTLLINRFLGGYEPEELDLENPFGVATPLRNFSPPSSTQVIGSIIHTSGEEVPARELSTCMTPNKKQIIGIKEEDKNLASIHFKITFTGGGDRVERFNCEMTPTYH